MYENVQFLLRLNKPKNAIEFHALIGEIILFQPGINSMSLDLAFLRPSQNALWIYINAIPKT